MSLRTDKLSPSILPFLAPFLFLLMWSSGAVMVKVGLQYASVWSFLTVRSAISLVAIICLYWLMKRVYQVEFRKPKALDWQVLLFVGLMVQVLYLAFYFLAIGSGISPGLVTLILGLQPLLTPLFMGQKVSATKLALLMLGFVGLGLAVAGSKALNELALSGFMFAIFAVTAITLGTIQQAKIRLHPVQAMLYQNSLSLIIFSLIMGLNDWQVTWSGDFILAALWMGLVVSIGALLLLMYMVQQESAHQVSVLFYGIPMLAYLFDYLIFGETLGQLTFIGMILVAISIMFYRRTSAR